ncbi:MAG: sugar porter family MFS transporter [Candidatus Obscuribacterales bacterium]|jgi:MFS transporter, SP family, arabinose:H+ symporter|nr:sugar porter family MFS transporter [Candidatus Obscuribacterales bacterium]
MSKSAFFLVKSALVGALGGLLFGFDTAVIAGTTMTLRQTFALDEAALGFTVSSALWGTVLSALTAGIPGEKYGSREALRITAILYVISAFGCALAHNWWLLIAFRFIGGLGIGASSVLGPVYISEIAPAQYRGRMVGLFQVNIVVGILLAYLSNYLIGLQHFGADEWRWQLGVSAIPALLFAVMLFTIPRSPRWLAARGLDAESLGVLEQATGSTSAAQAQLAEIKTSIGEEALDKQESLFNGKYKKPIMLALILGSFNQFTGINAILYYLNDIFAKAGFDKVSSDLQAVAIGATNLIFTLIAMAVIDQFGRKPLLLIGSVGCAACLLGVAYIFGTHTNQHLLIWLLVAYIGFFAASQGACIWVYISEIFPTKVRARGQGLGCSAHWICNAIISGAFPIFAQISSSLPFVFFGLMMVLQLVLVWRLFPETKGISLEKLQEKLGITV